MIVCCNFGIGVQVLLLVILDSSYSSYPYSKTAPKLAAGVWWDREVVMSRRQNASVVVGGSYRIIVVIDVAQILALVNGRKKGEACRDATEAKRIERLPTSLYHLGTICARVIKSKVR